MVSLKSFMDQVIIPESKKSTLSGIKLIVPDLRAGTKIMYYR